MGYVNSSIFHLLLCPTIIYKVIRRFSILGLGFDTRDKLFVVILSTGVSNAVYTNYK